EIRVFPTHGGGSFCGVGGRSGHETTLGHERKTNPFFQTTEVMPFLARALTQSRYPTYYRDMSAINRGGAPLIGRTLPPLTPLEADEVAQMMDSGAAVIDIRTGRDYDAGHIPGSYQVGIDGPVSAWVGWLVAGGRPRARSRTHLRARRAAPRGRDPARRASGGSLRVRVSRRNRSEPSRAGRPEADHPRERRILGLGPPPPCGVTPLADIRSGYFTSPSASSRVVALIAGSCGVGGRADGWVGQEVLCCSRGLRACVGSGTAHGRRRHCDIQRHIGRRRHLQDRGPEQLESHAAPLQPRVRRARTPE